MVACLPARSHPPAGTIAPVCLMPVSRVCPPKEQKALGDGSPLHRERLPQP